jgi:hypothetical protein
LEKVKIDRKQERKKGKKNENMNEIGTCNAHNSM